MPGGVNAWVTYPTLRLRTAPSSGNGGNGDALGFDHLEEINDLVLHVWDAAVLHCLLLADEPMRFSDIGAAVDQWSQRRPNDSDITRALDRLRKAGYVRRSDSGSRRTRIHTLTPSGRDRASKIGILIGVLEANDTEDEMTQARRRADGGGLHGRGPDSPTK